MLQSIGELKKMMRARVKSDEIERDEEGRAVIAMSVRNDEDFLSDFSVGSKPVISEEVASFLNENAMAFVSKEPICIKIYSDCIDEYERNVYSNALREYYSRHYESNRRKIFQNSIVSVLLAIVGFVALAVMLTFKFLESHAVLSEALDIFAWVFLWEAVDMFFLERRVLLYEQNRCLRFIDARLQFYPLQANPD